MTTKKLKYLTFFITIASLLLIANNMVMAAYLGGQQSGDLWEQMHQTGVKGYGYSPGSEKALPALVATIIKAFLGLLGVIFVTLIIYAGYGWMTAQGDEEKVKKAKDTLTQAIIGLIIITAAYAITYFVFSNLPGGAGGGTPGGGIDIQ